MPLQQHKQDVHMRSEGSADLNPLACRKNHLITQALTSGEGPTMHTGCFLWQQLGQLLRQQNDSRERAPERTLVQQAAAAGQDSGALAAWKCN